MIGQDMPTSPIISNYLLEISLEAHKVFDSRTIKGVKRMAGFLVN